jgi:hypothetical protein
MPWSKMIFSRFQCPNHKNRELLDALAYIDMQREEHCNEMIMSGIPYFLVAATGWDGEDRGNQC